MSRLIVFDTTLRDGEQCPGASLNISEKLEIAQQLERLGVDVIEAGFPISSPGDLEAVATIARTLQNTTVAGLARSLKKDIDAAWEALRGAVSPRIHVFLATSRIHMQYKLKKAEEEILKQAVEAVTYARKKVDDVEFSPEDASRTDLPFLARIVEAVIRAGARTVNIPDTVGYAVPQEFGGIIRYLKTNVPNIDEAVISVHCHNDLGLAVANSLAAVSEGARQVECTINGIGERAGNASLEEVVMALKTRKDAYKRLSTGIHTRQLIKTSRLVSRLTSLMVQPNKAIVGSNAFAHEAGIHQDGVLKHRKTYEIMNPASVGLSDSLMVLGKHSGKHAFRSRLKKLGYNLTDEEIVKAFDQFKVLADRKKVVYDEDLEAIADDSLSRADEIFKLKYMNISSSTPPGIPTATLKLEKDGKILQDAPTG
jgi:2-isopropylmalate synthase